MEITPPLLTPYALVTALDALVSAETSIFNGGDPDLQGELTSIYLSRMELESYLAHVQTLFSKKDRAYCYEEDDFAQKVRVSALQAQQSIAREMKKRKASRSQSLLKDFLPDDID